MADRKISDLTALTAPASGDYLPIVDISEAAAASKNKRITIEELFRGVPSGTAAAPSIAIEGDEDTGVYSPGANQLAISTGGSGRLFVDASGNVGISAAPDVRFALGDFTSNEAIRIRQTANGYGTIYFANGSSGANLYQGFIEYAAGTAGDFMRFGTAQNERLRLTSTGALNFVGAGTAGVTQAVSFNGSAPVNSLVIDSSGYVQIGTTNNPAAAQLIVTKAGGTQGFEFLPGSASTVNTILNYNRSTSAYLTSAINALSHTWSLSGSPAMTLDSSGRLGIGTSSPGAPLSIKAENSDAFTLNFADPAVVPAFRLINGQGTAAGCIDGWKINYRPSYAAGSGTGSDKTAIQLINTHSRNDADLSLLPSGGRVGIGTTSPQFDCTVSKQGTGVTSYIGIRAGENGSASTSNAAVLYYRIRGGGPGDVDANITYSYNGAYLLQSSSQDGYTWSTSAGEAVRIDSSRRLLVGTSSARNNFYNGANTNQVQIEGTTYQNSGLALTCNNSYFDDTAVLCFNKSATTSIGSNTPVGSTHKLGAVTFQGNDGTEFVEAAKIEAFVDGNPGANDMPGRLVFSTTADGASSPTERARINQNGSFGMLSANNGDTLYVSNGATAGTTVQLISGRHTASSMYAGTESFRVWTNGNVQNTNNSYTIISDAKLKENIVDANSQWNDIKAVKIRNWNYKSETGYETHRQIGPIAQELEQVCPKLVFETPDRDEDGTDLGTTTKGVNTSVLYMKAVKALQEAMERIEQLEAKVAALESA